MKMRSKFIFAFILCLSVLGGVIPFASADGPKEIDIYINKQSLSIPANFGRPFYDESKRLQIPMRYIIESCGYEVVWDNNTQTATVPTEDGNVIITLGSATMITPTGTVSMDTSAIAKDNRTYIPLRFALEALGFDVTWTAGTASDRVDITGTVGVKSSKVPMTAAQVSDAASPAVFYIEVSDFNGVPFASGSGFFIDSLGTGVTNYHVIEGAYSSKLTLVDGSQYEMGMILYYDVARDIAIFSAYPSDPSIKTVNTPYLNLAEQSSVHNGDVVYAIGSPLGLQNSITDGLVSNKNRILPGESLSYIQTSAPISHGNSGGPLLNTYGEVIGVNTAMLADGQNLNLAIPSNVITQADYSDSSKWAFLFEVADKEGAIPPPTNIRIVREVGDSAYFQWDPVDGAEYYHFYYQPNGDDTFWYDGEDAPMPFYYESDYSVQYSGLSVGTTYNIIVTAVKDGRESRDSEIFSFTFTGNYVANVDLSTPYYPDAWWLPDFSKLYKTTPSHHGSSAGIVSYFYLDFTSENAIDYLDVLSTAGYEFLNGELGKDGWFYSNRSNGAYLLYNIVTTEAGEVQLMLTSALPSETNISTQVPTTTYSFPLHLYSNDGSVYLGKLTTNTYDNDSIWNPYGTYGSKYNANSIWNEFGTYGSKYSTESAFNPYTQTPPKIVDNNGTFWGYLTANEYLTNGYTIIELQRFLQNNKQ